MLLIGSKALNCHISPRPTKDEDYICSYECYQNFINTMGSNIITYPISANRMLAFDRNDKKNIIEFEIAWEGSSAEDILEWAKEHIVSEWKDEEYRISSLPLLLMLKLSHRYLKNSPHFEKTRKDILLLRSLTSLTPELEIILKKREKETYDYKHPNLSQNKKAFFDDSVKYVFSHDDIHRAIAIDETPAYTKFQADNSEVKTSKKKFFKLDDRTRLLAGMEESFVLAIERSLVPHPGVMTPDQAFLFALKKVCSSITSGWFREYIYDHYDEVVALYRNNQHYWSIFNQAVAEGKVRLFGED